MNKFPVLSDPVLSDPGVRRCKACTVCCVALPIPEGHLAMGPKAAGVPCINLVDHGCGRYEDRPAACRDFLCTWLADAAWPDAWRPDLSGLLSLREELEPGLVGAVVYEIEAGALESDVAKEILGALYSTVTILVVVDANGHRRKYAHLADDPASPPGLQPHHAAA